MQADLGFFQSRKGGPARKIIDTIPHAMPGERVVTDGTSFTFPDTVFKNSWSMPFRVHRIRIDITGFNGATPPVAVSPETSVLIRDALPKYVRVNFEDIDASQPLTKAPTLVAALVNRRSWAWEFRSPYDVETGGSFQVSVDNILASFSVNNETVANLRVEITFEGELLVLE